MIRIGIFYMFLTGSGCKFLNHTAGDKKPGTSPSKPFSLIKKMMTACLSFINSIQGHPGVNIWCNCPPSLAPQGCRGAKASPCSSAPGGPLSSASICQNPLLSYLGHLKLLHNRLRRHLGHPQTTAKLRPSCPPG